MFGLKLNEWNLPDPLIPDEFPQSIKTPGLSEAVKAYIWNVQRAGSLSRLPHLLAKDARHVQLAETYAFLVETGKPHMTFEIGPEGFLRVTAKRDAYLSGAEPPPYPIMIRSNLEDTFTYIDVRGLDKTPS